VKTCANERNAKLALAFYSECSQVSSARSAVKAASKRAQRKIYFYYAERNAGLLAGCLLIFLIVHKKTALFFDVSLLCINFACPKMNVLDII
jgi:hypothetical protein